MSRGADETEGAVRDGATRDFLLVRVDDRLLHGQVVYGWAGRLGPECYVVVDDRAAGDPWEAEAFGGASGGLPVRVVSVEGFAREWRSWPRPERTFVLVRDLASLRRLWKLGFRPSSPINVGGIRSGPGSLEIYPFLQLSAEDRREFSALLELGCPLVVQELPDSPRLDGVRLAERLNAERL